MGVYSGNRTLLGESTYNADEPAHIMEMVLECERNDLRMFEAVINCDFIEAYNEAGIISLSEEGENSAKNETKKGVVQKIKDLFKKAIEAVKRFIATFIAKVKNMFANDAKLYKQYQENFSKNAVGYKISSWRILKRDPMSATLKLMQIAAQSIRLGTKKIDDATDNDAISKALELIKKNLKEEDIGSLVDKTFFGEKKENYKLSSEDVGIIAPVVKNSTNAINHIKNEGKYAVSELEVQRKELKAEAVNHDEKDELGLAKLNAKYKAGAWAVKYTNKIVNASCNAYARYLAQCRKAFVLAGKKAAAAGTDEQKAANEAYEFILGEASDSYVEQMLLID